MGQCVLLENRDRERGTAKAHHGDGVCLRDSTDGVPVRAYTHHTCDGWCVTSDSPPEALLNVRTSTNRLLPGPLGCYVYPDDSVFHLSTHTRGEPWPGPRRVQAVRNSHTER